MIPEQLKFPRTTAYPPRRGKKIWDLESGISMRFVPKSRHRIGDEGGAVRRICRSSGSFGNVVSSALTPLLAMNHGFQWYGTT
jgi:hypothetical protein